MVDSTADDLALTTAHRVYSHAFAANIEYVPGYHDGKQPYGAWPVAAITGGAAVPVNYAIDLERDLSATPSTLIDAVAGVGDMLPGLSPTPATPIGAARLGTRPLTAAGPPGPGTGYYAH